MLKRYDILILCLLLCLFLAGCQQEGAEINPNEEPVEGGEVEKPPVQSQPTVIIEPESEPEPELPGAIFVMVDNHTKARPQSNLDKADIVYEFVCEGTITRFMAGYYSIDPVTVGPIRSARYYYAQMIKPYNTPYVHVGGNMDAMEMIKDLDLKDICDITNASGYFFRDKSRKMPHNSYAEIESIIKFAKKRNYEFTAFPELPVGENEGGTTVNEIELVYGTERYPNTVTWCYDEESEHYLRKINSDPHCTAEGERLYADNIIVLEMPVKTVEVPVDGVASEINVLGKGKALFLRDGQMYEGQWEKSKVSKHFNFTLKDGKTYHYEEGNVWVQQVRSIAENVITSSDATQ